MDKKVYSCLCLLLLLSGCTQPEAQPTVIQRPPYVQALPEGLLEISAQNAGQVQMVAHFGRGRFQSLAFSPDGRWLAAGTSIGVSLMDAETLEEKQFIHTCGWVKNLAFSPSSSLLAMDGRLIWLKDGQAFENFPGGMPVFSNNGTWVATAQDDTVMLWEVDGGAQRYKFQTAWVSSLDFSPDGQYLAAASYRGASQGFVDLMNTANGQRTNLLDIDDPVFSLDFSPDGQWLAVGTEHGQISIRKAQDGSQVRALGSWLGAFTGGVKVYDLEFSPDGLLLAASWGGKVVVWDTARWGKTELDMDATIYSVAFSADSARLAAAGHGTYLFEGKSQLKVWQVKEPEKVYILGVDVAQTPVTASLVSVMEENERVDSLAVSPDGRLVAAGLHDNIVRLWSIPEGQLQKEFGGQGDMINSLAFTPDSQTLAISDDGLTLWQAPDWRRVGAYKTYGVGVAFAPDGKTLAAAEPLGPVQIYSQADGKIIKTLAGKKGVSRNVTYSHDGSLLAAGSANDFMQVWNVEDGSLLYLIKSSGFMIQADFSPDDRLLAISGWTAKIFNTADGSLVRELNVEGNDVNSVAFSADGALLATACDDGLVRLWRVSDGALLAALHGHGGTVDQVAFSPDGRWIASAGEDGTVMFWGMIQP